MKSLISKQVERFLREQKNYRRWLAVFLCLAVVVTIGTTAALKYKGIAVTGDDPAAEEMHMDESEEIPEGYRLHVHTDDCYEEREVKVLVCGYGHVHDESCYAAEGGEAEKPEETAPEQQKPEGTAPEQKPDSSSEASSPESKPAPEPETKEERILACDEEEGHTHGDDCYETKTVEEVVGTDEEGNDIIETHEEKELTCDKEEGHTHSDSCYEVKTVEVAAVAETEEAAPAAETAEAAQSAETTEVALAADSADTAPEAPVADAGENAAQPEIPAADAEENTAQPETPATDETPAPETEKNNVAENGERRLICGKELGEGAEEEGHTHTEECYEIRMEKVLVCDKEGTLEKIPFEGGVQECVAGNVKVIAEYGPEAEIPANAVLKAKQITEEDDPEYYAEREAEYLEKAGEDAVLDMLLDIGFYVDGKEIEPNKDATVSITIEMLDDVYEDGEELNVIHFGSEETEKLNASEIETNREGNKTTSFEASSFSTFAIGTQRSLVNDLEDGKKYMVYCTSGKKTYALVHKDEQPSGSNNWDLLKLEVKEVTLENGRLVSIPTGYTVGDFQWTYSKNEGLKYNCESQKKDYYLNYSSYYKRWELYCRQSDARATLSDGIKIYNNSYLNCSVSSSGAVISVGESKNGSTDWIFAKTISDKYTVKYWTNTNNVITFKKPSSTKQEQYTEIELNVSENGKIEIPVSGYVNNEYVGKLEDYTNNGHTYKFYGWSLKNDANYQQTADYLIYCGDPEVKINGITVPTYVREGIISLDAEDIEGDTVDLYATWAAPSQIEGNNGIEYYGSGATSKNQTSTNPIKGAVGVLFFVRLDGTLPAEPATSSQMSNIASSNYTDAIAVDSPFALNYWMHIYGNEDAVEANLRYKPTNEQIYNAVKNAINAGKEIKVADKKLTADDIGKNAEEFARKYYVKWYVCKDSNQNVNNNESPDCWHIDGVLLGRNVWNLKYRDPEITIKNNTIIPDKQYAHKENEGSATVNNTYVNNVESPIEPTRNGYIFKDWNTESDGSGVAFKAGDEITVDLNGDVYRLEAGEWQKIKTDDTNTLKADKRNEVWEVTLYPQWERITHNYTIRKVWSDKETDLINPAIQSIKIKVSKYTEGNQNNPEVVGEYELKSSDNWETKIEGLYETDDDGNQYTYIMEELNIIGSDGEISGAVGSYELTWLYDNIVSSYFLTNKLNPEKIVDVSVKKTDAVTGEGLAGAEFTLIKVEGNKEVTIDTYTSGDNGIAINACKLIEGKYKLQETKAPAGYLKNEAVISFEVTKNPLGSGMILDAETTSAEAQDWEFNEDTNTFTIKDKPAVFEVTVKKIANQNLDAQVGLPGAEFVVMQGGQYIKEEGNEIIPTNSRDDAKKYTTLDDGMVVLNLPVGEYSLVEVKAPDGFNLREDPISFEVKLDGGELKLEWKPTAVYPEVHDKIKDSDTVITVINYAGIVLPETGGPGTAAYTFGGLTMIIAVSLMYGLNMRRKRGKGGMM